MLGDDHQILTQTTRQTHGEHGGYGVSLRVGYTDREYGEMLWDMLNSVCVSVSVCVCVCVCESVRV